MTDLVHGFMSDLGPRVMKMTIIDVSGRKLPGVTIIGAMRCHECPMLNTHVISSAVTNSGELI